MFLGQVQQFPESPWAHGLIQAKIKASMICSASCSVMIYPPSWIFWHDFDITKSRRLANPDLPEANEFQNRQEGDDHFSSGLFLEQLAKGDRSRPPGRCGSLPVVGLRRCAAQWSGLAVLHDPSAAEQTWMQGRELRCRQVCLGKMGVLTSEENRTPSVVTRGTVVALRELGRDFLECFVAQELFHQHFPGVPFL